MPPAGSGQAVSAAPGATSASAPTATVFDLLETLPRISLDRLYGLSAAGSEGAGGSSKPPPPPSPSSPYPWTCRAVFQSLPPLAKQYVMRLLCLEGAVTRALLDGWVDPAAGARAREAHRRAVRRLDRLRILLTAPGNTVRAWIGDWVGTVWGWIDGFGWGRGGGRLIRFYVRSRPHPNPSTTTKKTQKQDAFELNPPFRAHLRAALASHRAGPWMASDPSLPPLKPDPHPQTPQQLEGYMCGKWNAVLHFLVGSADTGGFDEPAEEVGSVGVLTESIRVWMPNRCMAWAIATLTPFHSPTDHFNRSIAGATTRATTINRCSASSRTRG